MSSFEREERKKAEIWTTQRRRGSEYEALLYYYRQCYIDGVILSKISRLEFFTRRSTSFQLYSSLVKKTKIYLSRSRCIRILSVKNILPSRQEGIILRIFLDPMHRLFERLDQPRRRRTLVESFPIEIKLSRKLRLFSVCVFVCGMHTYMQLANA